MRFGLRSVVVLVVCVLVSFQSAWGWGPIGHMAVAYVAFQHLTPQQQIRVAALLRKNPDYKYWKAHFPPNATEADRRLYAFMLAATWPDLIKGTIKGYKDDGNDAPATPEATQNEGYRDKFMHKYWHYVDVPFSPDNTTLVPTPTVNAQMEIALLRRYLASPGKDSIKSYDLVWLEHIVGDVHQPLHCTSRFTADATTGDIGGNLVKIDVAPKKLHTYWDDLPGVPDSATGEPGSLTQAIAFAKALGEPDATAAADLNEAHWVNESFQLAKSNVYANPPIGVGLGPYAVSATPDYATNSLALAKKQVALAGVRLAGLINAELK